MKSYRLTLNALIMLILSTLYFSCASPKTFVRTMDPSWAKIELREDMSYDRAWQQVMDLLIRNFDIEIAQKENGYIRTGWLYTWTGRVTNYYRVRITVKFPEDRKALEIKSEAYYRDSVGYDSRLLDTYKSDIMGTVGRVTR